MNEFFDAIIILGGGLKKDIGGWRTTNFNEGDNFGCLGDRLRVVAGVLLYNVLKKKNPGLSIIVSGGRGQFRNVPGAPPVSVVLKKELIELGVRRADIEVENKSGTTYQQLKKISKLVLKSGMNKIVIITNRCHMPRVRALIENVKDLELLKKQLSAKKIFLKSAEDIALRYDRKNWKSVIDYAYKSKLMKKRLLLEKQGVRQLKAGLYKLR